jgi:hypothetical protein
MRDLSDRKRMLYAMFMLTGLSSPSQENTKQKGAKIVDVGDCKLTIVQKCGARHVRLAQAGPDITTTGTRAPRYCGSMHGINAHVHPGSI